MKEDEHDEVFSRFVTQNSAGLRRTAFLLTGSSGGAEDLLQDALVKLWLRWRHVDQASATAYARRIMVNLSHGSLAEETLRDGLGCCSLASR